MRELAMRRRQQAQITRLRESERFKDGIGKKRKRSAKMDAGNGYENLENFLTMNNMDEGRQQYRQQPQKFQNQNWMFKNTGVVLE